jgi:hypothetical protein
MKPSRGSPPPIRPGGYAPGNETSLAAMHPAKPLGEFQFLGESRCS